MAKRHFLQLAHTYVHGAPIGGYYASIKLDGQRAFWDSGITRGVPATKVPFANTDKDARLLKPPVATGLWSRYGKVIHAPAWWLDLLPPYPLDGELWAGNGGFQTLMSIVKDHNPGPGWSRVTYKVFDSPPPHIVFGDGEINETNFRKKFVHLASKLPKIRYPFVGAPQFREVISWLKGLQQNDVFQVHEQTELPPFTRHAVETVNTMLEAVTSSGGEGLMLRNPTSTWLPNRVRSLLKMKALNDAEGTVIGYIWGRETELGSKLLGLMGALILDYKGKRLELSGFTDAERVMSTTDIGIDPYATGVYNAGKEVQTNIYNPKFPRNSKITFRYRELSDEGIPKEARYWRKHVNG